MKRILLFLGVIFLLFPKSAFAQKEFNSNATITYDVAENGTTTVIYDITLENNSSNLYASSYTLDIDGIKPINPRSISNGVNLPVEVNTDGEKATINVKFSDSLVGKGNSRNFQISFDEKDLATKTGEIWEISTAKQGDLNSFDSFNYLLRVPVSFGQLAYVSPTPSSQETIGNKNVYNFTKGSIGASAVTAGFGQFQVFSFNLTYHLENPLGRDQVTQIAIPPDTSYQRVIYDSIKPTPIKVDIDQDGNWLGSFKLKSHERIDVNLAGSVQIFATGRKLLSVTKEDLDKNMKETEFWQTSNPKIQALAHELKTPNAIYDWVVSNLSYDYGRVKPNVERFGATKAIDNPKNAICTEFTDTFIAIARAAGIPAREINGYAYTENPQIQPLSLVADVLHAWPEYWDASRGVWVPVDPTWGETSGIDYFTKLDLRHFTFVIHGADARKPYPPGSYKLGPNPQKDVFVSFGQLPPLRNSTVTVSQNILQQIPYFDMQEEIKIKNSGPVALYNQNITVIFDKEVKNKITIPVIPPFSEYSLPVTIPYSFLGQGIPEKLTIVTPDGSFDFGTYRTYVIISNLASILGVIFLITFLIYYRVIHGKAKKSTT